MEAHCLPEQKREVLQDAETKENISIINTLKKENRGYNLKCQVYKTTDLVAKKANEQNDDTKKLELYGKVTKEDLQNLCDQLSSFNMRIKTARDMICLRDELPFILQNKLEEEAGELECLNTELQSAFSNIETIQNQRAALNKEKLCFTNQINQLKADTVQEMEVIVSIYDSNMMEKWETVKKTNSTQEVENFLHDVEGKLEAMRNLQTLVTQKLTVIKNQTKQRKDDTERKQAVKENKMVKTDEKDDSQSRSCRSVSIIANSSQMSLSFLLDSDPEDMMDENGMNGVLYNLVCEQVLSLPTWTQSYTSDPMDTD